MPQVVTIRGLTHGYPGRGQLFNNANLDIEKGDRVAILGPNGAGGRGIEHAPLPAAWVMWGWALVGMAIGYCRWPWLRWWIYHHDLLPSNPTRTPHLHAGKSTLLRLIMGREDPQAGQVNMGEHNIVPNYFEQVRVRDKVLEAMQICA